MDSILINDMTLNNKMSIQQIQKEAELFLSSNFISFEGVEFIR